MRKETEYFGLDGLVKLLVITYSCSPEADGSKDILFWMGTKKGTVSYFNPYHRGAVSFTGYVSKKDRERCRREVTCRHAVILKRERKTLQKTFVANAIRDKTLNPFSLDRKSVVIKKYLVLQKNIPIK